MANDRSQEIEKLRQLLLVEQDNQKIAELEAELQRLRAYVDDAEVLQDKVEPILADAIARKIDESRDEMADALAPVMGQAIKRQIREAKDDITDALYPVIGSTIRKAVAEAMRKLAQTVNEKLNRAFSMQLIAKRIKARLTGVPAESLIIKDSLPFQIEQIFLIHRETGILLAHTTHPGSHFAANRELVSGMLTAIKDFAPTVVESGEYQDVNKISYDDFEIYVEPGKYTYLALVISGVEPENFYEEVHRFSERIHRQYHKELRVFDGEVAPFAPLQSRMRALIQDFSSAGAEKARKPPSSNALKIVLGLAAIALILFLALHTIPNKLAERRLHKQIENLQAAEPRVDAAGIQLQVHGHTLRASGAVASQRMKDELLRTIAGAVRYRNFEDHITVRRQKMTLSQLHALLQEKLAGRLSADLSSVRFVIDGDALLLNGSVATETDKMLLAATLAHFAPFRVIVNNLAIAPGASEVIAATKIYFAQGSAEITPAERQKLLALAQTLRCLPFDTLLVIGHSDALGTPTANMTISRRRAENVKQFLVQQGVPAGKVVTRGMGFRQPVSTEDTEAARARNRRVEFRIQPEGP